MYRRAEMTSRSGNPLARHFGYGAVVAIGLGLAVARPFAAMPDPSERTQLAQAGAETGVGQAPFNLDDPARIQAGKKRFNKLCAGYCHGSEGVGGRAPDFKGRTDLDLDYAFKTISEGRRGADVMPPWGNALTADQIWELVAYLKFLGTQKVDK